MRTFPLWGPFARMEFLRLSLANSRIVLAPTVVSAAAGVFCWPCQPTCFSISFYSACAMDSQIIFGYTFMSKNPRPGRPKLADSEKRKPAFLLKLTDDEFERVKRAADGKVSTWAREV